MVKHQIDWQIFHSGRTACFESRQGTNLLAVYLRKMSLTSGGLVGGKKPLNVFSVVKGWCRYEAVAKIQDRR